MLKSAENPTVLLFLRTSQNFLNGLKVCATGKFSFYKSETLILSVSVFLVFAVASPSDVFIAAAIVLKVHKNENFVCLRLSGIKFSSYLYYRTA